MVFNSALCFALVALALASEQLWGPRVRGLQILVGLAVLLLSAAILSQYVDGVDLGIDWAGSQPYTAANPFPGRMPVSAALGFMLCGALLVVMHRVKTFAEGLAVQAMTGLVVADGMVGLLGHIIPLQLFFDDYLFGETALSLSGLFVVAGAAFWWSWRDDAWYTGRRLIRRDDQRIALIGVLTMAVAVCGSMVGGFAVMAKQVEHLAASAQTELLRSHVLLLRLNLDQHIGRAALIADRPGLREQLGRLNKAPDPASQERLRTMAEALLSNGFSAMEIGDAEGRTWVSVGKFVPDDSMGVTLRSANPAILYWQDGFVLRTRVPLSIEGSVAVMKAEQRLPALSEQLKSAQLLDESGEIGLCGRNETQFVCFPQRMIPEPYSVPYSAALPMGMALEGKTGVVTRRDYRDQNVVAAYGPAGDFGLGMVVKEDTSELYLPLRSNMYRLLLVMLLIVAGGGWLLYRRVSPLVHRMEFSESRLQQALEGSRLSLWDWDLKAGSVYLSEKWAEMLGQPAFPMTMQADKLQAMVHPEDLPVLLEHLQMVFKGKESSYDLEHRIRLPNGAWRWIRSRGKVAERDAEGRVTRMIGTNVDISGRKEAEIQLANRASHDALTGLPNRLFLPDRLAQAMARSRRQKSLMAVLYLDIDRFKGINDTLGHEAGDMLLKEFAARITLMLRATDTAVRLGGDEIVLILEGLHCREDGERVTGKLAAAMQPPFSLGKGTLRVTTSGGMAFYDGTANLDGDALLRKADEALYAAKGAGRNNIRIAPG